MKALKNKEELYDGMSMREAFNKGNALNTDYIVVINGLIAPNIKNNDYEILHKCVEPYDNDFNDENKELKQFGEYCEFSFIINVSSNNERDVRICVEHSGRGIIRKYPQNYSIINDDAIMVELAKNIGKNKVYEKVYFCFDNHAIFDDISEHYKCKLCDVSLLR